MAKKNQKRKIVRLVSEAGDSYYTTRHNDNEKLNPKKYSKKLRRVVQFKEVSKNLGRNEVKKRK